MLKQRVLKFQVSAMNCCREKYDRNFCNGQTDTHTMVKQYTPSSFEWGIII